MDPTFLQTLWFVLICVLWIGYFVLEGFDFGVGALLRTLGRDRTERRMLMHTIGPVWDANEVWLLVAGGATFAAFPGWYASLFSGAYLALFLILVALIVRGVAFEFWGKSDSPRWRSTWEWAMVLGSALPALLWGVAWANIVRGIPLNAQHDMTGNLFDLLGPYAIAGGAMSLVLFLSHGATFLTLRTTGELHERSLAAARRLSPFAALLVIAFLVWTLIDQGDRGGVQLVSAVLAVAAMALAVVVPLLLRARDDARGCGWAFGLSAAAIALTFCALFADLFPNALPSTISPAFDLTLREAASTSYTLTVMTVVAVLLLPVVLVYQAWTYWVFRARLGRADFEEIRSPVDMVAKLTGGTPGDGAATPSPGSVAPPAPPSPTGGGAGAAGG